MGTMPENQNPHSIDDSKATPTPKPHAPDHFIGKMIGNCRIIEKINEGGTAHIYRAHNIRFDLDRVVKILKPALAEDEEFYTRFRQEAQLTARLDHPNILRVFDTGEAEGHFYIETEYISGQTLRSYIQSTPHISEREVLQIGLHVIKALEYAHTIKIEAPNKEVINGILHRDIKPENIMLTPDRWIKLMDFGAAKPLNITSDTMQGMIVGTFHYMSPEQICGRDLDVRSDFFSLGIVLYELCTGQKPFTAMKLTGLIEKIRDCKYPKLHTIRPAISPMTEELIERLLMKSPRYRPSSAREIKENINIRIHSLNAWGAGRAVHVPFSIRQAFPTIALAISLIALTLSLFAVFHAPFFSRFNNTAQTIQISLLEKGHEFERKEQWSEAVNIYELVLSTREGGLANEYLEAQLRMAYICQSQLNQLTHATSILENLRTEYSDPAIDAYLGLVYFRRSLYSEARARIDAALCSKKGSVIQQTPEFKRELLFYYASTLDKQFTFVDHNEGLRIEAVKSWNYYIEFSECGKNPNDRDCRHASERVAVLQKP
jgi:serine/threonine protein kinase